MIEAYLKALASGQLRPQNEALQAVGKLFARTGEVGGTPVRARS